MERKLLKDFELDPKNRSEEALQRWRSAVSIVKNPRRRFRHVADLAKRSAAVIKRRKIQVWEMDVYGNGWDAKMNECDLMYSVL